MARDEIWAIRWTEYINDLGGLRFIPSEQDSKRIKEIMTELKEIVKRNKEQED